MNDSVLRRIGAGLLLSVSLLSFALPAVSAESESAGAGAELRHGSRREAADGTMLVYDNVNGIFLVPGQKDTFWTADKFYHYDGGVWATSKSAKGPWSLLAEQLVPKPARNGFGPLRKQVTAKLPSGDEAVYDPTLRAYKVASKKGVFLVDALFYRYDSGLWLSSPKVDGAWSIATIKSVPGPLRKAVPAPKGGDTVTLPSGDVLAYDSNSKLFQLQGKTSVVLYDGTFYEKQGGKWMASPSATSGFEEIDDSKLPAHVRNKYLKGSAAGAVSKPKTQAKKGDGKTAAKPKGEKTANGDRPTKKQRQGAAKDNAAAKPARANAKQGQAAKKKAAATDDESKDTAAEENLLDDAGDGDQD